MTALNISTPLHLREATLDDLPILLDFEQALVAYERPFAPQLRQGKIHYYDLKAYIQNPDVCVVVAERKGEILGSGYALIRENAPYKTPSQLVYLGFMYVRPEHRGEGINAKVMQYLIQWGKDQGFTEFQLDVYDENTSARKAYEKMGFVPEILTMRLDNIPPENQK